MSARGVVAAARGGGYVVATREGVVAEDGPARLLVVEDDENVLEAVTRRLGAMGYAVEGVRAGAEALALAREIDFDVCVLDVNLPDGLSGIELIPRLEAIDPDIVTVVMTGDVSAERGAAALAAGAAFYVEKPILDWVRFQTRIEQSLERRRAGRAVAPEREPEGPDAAALLIELRRRVAGGSKAMDDLRRSLVRLAGSPRPLALIGPSGSGRAWLSESLHHAEGRPGPFEVVRAGEGARDALFGVGGLPGALERTRRGTLVIAEAEGLTPELVAAVRVELARPGREGRLVLTSTVPPERWPEGLAVPDRLDVPPLSARLEDLPHLVYAFVQDVNQLVGRDLRRVPQEVFDLLRRRDWSEGNCRALRQAVEQAALFSPGEVLEVAALPREGMAGGPAPGQGLPPVLPEGYRGLLYPEFKEQVLHDFVALYVRDLLDRTGGNITRASELAGMHRPNFKRLMVRFGIDSPRDRDE